MDIVGSGALNLDIVYEVDDLAPLQREGFALHPGRETSGDHETAARLMQWLEANGRLVARTGGGSSANTVCALSRLGHSAAFLGVVGEDPEGAFILGEMGAVDCSLVRRQGRSALCVVVLDRGHRDRAMFVAPHGEEVGGTSPEAVKLLGQAKAAHLSSLAGGGGLEAQESLLSSLSDAQVLSFDPGELYMAKGVQALLRMLSRTDVLFITEEEVEQVTGEPWEKGAELLYPLLHVRRGRISSEVGAAVFRENNGPLVVIKQGRRGATAFAPGFTMSVPAEQVETVVDNTGAGDAFDAGFLDGLFRGRGIASCLASGAGLAARSLSGFGRAWLKDFQGAE